MKTLYPILAALLAILAQACSTASVRVMPGEDGVHRVVVRDIEKDDAEEEAVDAANEYCEDRKKDAVFLSEGTEYSGSMKEETRSTVRNASKAAMLLGSVGTVPGATRPFGGALAGAGIVGHSMTSDKDYKSEIKFRCK